MYRYIYIYICICVICMYVCIYIYIYMCYLSLSVHVLVIVAALLPARQSRPPAFETSPILNFHGNMWAKCDNILQNVAAHPARG